MTAFDSVSFRIGSSNRSHVVVHSMRRQYPDATDHDDGNWVYATIEIAANAFRGRYEANLRAEEFARFRDELRGLRNDVSGKAKFHPLEPWLQVDIQGDGKGHFRANCEATDRLGTGSRLTFSLEFDQTEIPAILRDLDDVCDAFPILGSH